MRCCARALFRKEVSISSFLPASVRRMGELAIWKRILLALSAIPLPIAANAFRVASIFVCAEYINPAFASKTWHDWSGLLFFFPASLLGLMLLHGLLAGEVPFLKRRRTVIRRTNTPDQKDITI